MIAYDYKNANLLSWPSVRSFGGMKPMNSLKGFSPYDKKMHFEKKKQHALNKKNIEFHWSNKACCKILQALLSNSHKSMTWQTEEPSGDDVSRVC